MAKPADQHLRASAGAGSVDTDAMSKSPTLQGTFIARLGNEEDDRTGGTGTCGAGHCLPRCGSDLCKQPDHGNFSGMERVL
mmetsp:Transcript_46573/g.86521  ORF Transcript_46573/g.86521 Transcript_46573/m.86521 type:complete len:81 (-) Transcript_46573:377-619(-)